MAVTTGGKAGRRNYATPDNNGLSLKGGAMLEHYVAASNVRLDNALKVDGVKVILWQRQPVGGKICSCHGSFKQTNTALARPTDGTTPVRETDSLTDDDDYRILGLGTKLSNNPASSGKRASITSKNFDNPADDNLFSDTDKNQAFQSGRKKAVEDELDVFDKMDFVDATSDGGLVTPGRDSTGVSTAEGSSCPVCAAATYVNGWQPSVGRRVVMSFLPTDEYDTLGELDTSSKPFTMTLQEGQTLSWTLTMPLLFSTVVRLALWEGREPLGEDDGCLEVHNGLTWVPASSQNIMALMGTRVVYAFRFTAPRKMILTHFDIIVLMADLPYAQFPPLNAPFEPEMLEYFTSISAEMSASSIVAPGDLLSDYKQMKMWRVTNVVRKFTAQGRAMHLAVDLKMIASYEAYFSLHPFQQYVENGPKAFSGQNEAFQGDL